MTEISNEDRALMKELMFGREDVQRFTQDSPVLPDVWLSYFHEPGRPHDLLLTPDWSSRPGAVVLALRKRLDGDSQAKDHSVSYNLSTVAVSLRFTELIRGVLPLTSWWREHVMGKPSAKVQRSSRRKGSKATPLDFATLKGRTEEIAGLLSDPENPGDLKIAPAVLWLVRVVGAIAWRVENPDEALRAVPATRKTWLPLVDSLARLLEDLPPAGEKSSGLVYRVTLNRVATVSMKDSTVAVKADAARRLFDTRCDQISWAVVDSGIDASHPAFALRGEPGQTPRGTIPTRIKETYDFTFIRDLLDMSQHARLRKERFTKRGQASALTRLEKHLKAGRDLDWALVEPLIHVSHKKKGYPWPTHDHGTHVAGVLAADWKEKWDGKEELVMAGVCPDIRLYDLRVLSKSKGGEEFAVIAALQFIRYLNARHDSMVIHGVNISLSIRHDVANYACGRTPVCDECDRLAEAGIVVVAAAGNQGYEIVETSTGPREGYHNISITDPGNTESVITVGSTHRNRPHTYGVSYFSSRGPTGDGRLKPDLVAPGEKILGPVPREGEQYKDGTSMAAPHVSGAAALIMARHPELIGQPDQIKKILMNTATDLGRERYFQGAGMLDILRAIQSV